MLDALATARTCRITTTGRRTGTLHVVVAVWFAVDGTTLFTPCRHGEASDWLRNAVAAPTVEVGAGRGRATTVGRVHLVVDPADIRRGAGARGQVPLVGTFVAGWLDHPPTMAAIELDR